MERMAFVEGRIYTLDKQGGSSIYGEGIEEIDGKKFREWIPWRSKMEALIKRLP